MVRPLAHRGPDDEGVWAKAADGIGLGHRRLAIVDLSADGHQPMVSARGRYVITYNGEVYNFAELRRELESGGERFRGHCDTEVLLCAIERWGIPAALRRLNGMFAFAVWDRHERRLTLARDRVGEKPLYYGWAGQRFLFGSELKALRVHPDFSPTLDRGALAQYMRFGYVPAPASIFEGVSKLLPGTYLTVAADDRLQRPVPYWSLAEAAASDSGAGHSDADRLEALGELLADAVRIRMRADVPLGAFLSGGVDSSLVVAMMSEASCAPVRTFTIGFEDREYDESAASAEVAGLLGTDHTNVTVSAADTRAVIPDLPSIYDEPFGDSSQIPTAILSRLTRSGVTVSMSGDGGDEVFGGYNRYTWAAPAWATIRRIPPRLRLPVARALRSVPPARWDSAFRRARPLVPARFHVRTPGTKLQKFGDILPARDVTAMYEVLVSHWQADSQLVLGAGTPRLAQWDEGPLTQLGAIERMMYIDTVTELPDDMLVKVDRATMSVGLEARVPLLDHRVIEAAWSLPSAMRVRGGEGKWALRELLRRRLPPEVVDRPKAGFGVPLHNWLRGPLREWAEDLLAERTLRQQGYLSPGVVRRVWAEHLTGRWDRQYPLWDVLMFQAWLALP